MNTTQDDIREMDNDTTKTPEPTYARAAEVVPASVRTLRRKLAGTTITKLDLDSVNLELSQALLGELSPVSVAKHLVGIIEHAETVGRDGSVQPDYRTQLAGIQLFLAHAVGRPIERQQILTANVSTEETESALAERIAGSPALKARLRELLKE